VFGVRGIEALGEAEGIGCGEHFCLFDNDHVDFDDLVWVHFSYMHGETFVMLVECFLGRVAAVDEWVVGKILLTNVLLDFLRLPDRHRQMLDHLLLPHRILKSNILYRPVTLTVDVSQVDIRFYQPGQHTGFYGYVH